MATRKLRRRPALGLAAALFAFAVALLVRLALGQIGLKAPLPFATFAPAVLIAPLLGGLRAGLIVMALAGVSAWWFLPPVGSFQLDASNGIVLVAFLASSALAIGLVHALDLEFEHLIAERRRSEDLFQELQHRVANNLQTVSSILRMQERDALDAKSARLALRDAGLRLSTVGALHRRLYSPDTRSVDLADHLDRICRDIVGASGRQTISCRVAATSDAELPASKLLTLSLIVNEMVVNAVKYAFPGERAGAITVRLEADGADLLLTVADDGVGLADASVPANGGGLGAQIVASLAAQLQGRPEWTSGAGTTFTLRFPR